MFIHDLIPDDKCRIEIEHQIRTQLELNSTLYQSLYPKAKPQYFYIFFVFFLSLLIYIAVVMTKWLFVFVSIPFQTCRGCFFYLIALMAFRQSSLSWSMHNVPLSLMSFSACCRDYAVTSKTYQIITLSCKEILDRPVSES